MEAALARAFLGRTVHLIIADNFDDRQRSFGVEGRLLQVTEGAILLEREGGRRQAFSLSIVLSIEDAPGGRRRP